MSFCPGMWGFLCPFLRWRCGMLKEGPRHAPAPDGSGSETCALEPEGASCLWPAASAFFKDVAGLVLSWPREKGIVLSPGQREASEARWLCEVPQASLRGDSHSHGETRLPDGSLSCWNPQTALLGAVLGSERYQQPAVPYTWLILSQSEMQGPAWAGSP